MTGFVVSRLGARIIALSLTFAPLFAAAHAAENARKVTVVSFGLYGDQGVFRSEATGAAQIVASRFGGGPVVVRFNTKTGGRATVETLAATLQAEAKKMNGESDILFDRTPTILCGLAVGYPDPDFPANRLHISRESIEKNVVFLDR